MLSIVGCSSDSPAPQARAVNIVERDFHIDAPNWVRAGKVTFTIQNKGPDDHEFIVVRTGRRGLPLRKDGLTVDEDAVEKQTAGALEPAAPGVEQLHARLKPGRYELFCNMSGHYMGGMHARIDVS